MLSIGSRGGEEKRTLFFSNGRYLVRMQRRWSRFSWNPLLMPAVIVGSVSSYTLWNCSVYLILDVSLVPEPSVQRTEY